MSFALYGPIRTWSIGSNPALFNIHLAGDKIWLYRQDVGRFSLYDLNLANELAFLKSTTDFERIHYFAVHRLGKNPEFYSGYGDGVSPRCSKPYGTCASELERYTYGASTTELLCPNENCDEGNINVMYYDAKTGKLIVSTDNSGNKLYLIDPDTKTFTKWSARGAGWATHGEVVLIPYDDNYLYVEIKKLPWGSGSFEIRRYRVDDFFANFGSGAIEDYGERVYYEETSSKRLIYRTVLTYAPTRKTIQVMDESTKNVYEYDPVSNTFTQIPYTWGYGKRYFGKYVLRYFDTYLLVVDLETHTAIQTVSFPSNQLRAHSTDIQPVDPIFVGLYDTNNVYVYLLTYNNVAPVIEYDHVNRKIRIVDFITKTPLRGELWVWKSRFCYSRDAYPLNITPETLSVSDWTQVPSAYKTECLTFAIKSVTS